MFCSPRQSACHYEHRFSRSYESFPGGSSSIIAKHIPFSGIFFLFVLHPPELPCSAGHSFLWSWAMEWEADGMRPTPWKGDRERRQSKCGRTRFPSFLNVVFPPHSHCCKDIRFLPLTPCFAAQWTVDGAVAWGLNYFIVFDPFLPFCFVPRAHSFTPFHPYNVHPFLPFVGVGLSAVASR